MFHPSRLAALLIAAAAVLPASSASAGGVSSLVQSASSSSTSAASAAAKVAKANAKATAAEINEAVATVPGAAPAGPISRLDTTRTGAASVTLDGVSMGLPAQGAPTVTDRVAVYGAGGSRAARIGVQSVGTDEVRALINITGPEAPERYEFPFGGQVASLQLQPDGSVLTLDAAGEPAGTVAAPWARDAAGREVPTHFEVQGTVLIQVVEHVGRGFQYGITADPSFKRKWWGYTVALNKTDVSNVAAASAAGAAAYIAAKVPHPVAKAAIAAVAYLFVQTAKGAKKMGRCMIWHATWAQPTLGWWTFPRC